jgi:hypothetical protein
MVLVHELAKGRMNGIQLGIRCRQAGVLQKVGGCQLIGWGGGGWRIGFFYDGSFIVVISLFCSVFGIQHYLQGHVRHSW